MRKKDAGPCQKQGDRVVAHVTFTGWEQSRYRKFKDAASLRRGPAGWGSLAPSHFGQVPSR